jgi:hypothetical protein
LYPLILAVFEKELFEVPSIDKIELSEIRDSSASCNSRFFLADPKRPIGSPESPSWNIRFNLRVTSENYLLNSDLSLSLPYWLDFDWVLDFMIDAREWASQPTLTTNSKGIILSLESGNLRDFYPYDESAIDKFTETFRKHLLIAKAVDRFSNNPTNRFLKSNVLQVIREMYEDK